ncbi:hypothetical protein [Chitinophaga rhizosphaerae]|uniref:hypothetical protein n=1 Tax=Chitinophaga rhizosphaerae TaxID=1864947 RepID=UPI000F80C6F2|nr:hypothetical protein [Chitinophaga rhizosphaerae]
MKNFTRLLICWIVLGGCDDIRTKEKDVPEVRVELERLVLSQQQVNQTYMLKVMGKMGVLEDALYTLNDLRGVYTVRKSFHFWKLRLMWA